jgi:hypothetical protein
LRRDAASAPSAFVPVRCTRRPSPEAGCRPRLCSTQGRPRHATHRSPCPRHAPCGLDAPLRSGGPSATPPSCVILRPGHHAVVTVGRAVPYLSALPSSSRRPTPRPPLHRARHCRLPVNSPLHESSVFSYGLKLFPRFTRSLCHHPLLDIAPPSPEPQPAAAAAAGLRRAPTPARSPPQLRPPPGPR